MNRQEAFVLPFSELTIADVPLVGGKNASLGEMYRDLGNKGVLIPNGFAVTAAAYRYFIEKAGIKEQIKTILTGLKPNSTKDLMTRGNKVRQLILQATIPSEITTEIIAVYKILSKESR